MNTRKMLRGLRCGLAPLASMPHPGDKVVSASEANCQACSPPGLLNMLRKPREGPVVLLAGEGGKGPASVEGSHYLENLHACIFFLPSVRNPCLAYQRDRFEHFQHTLFLMLLPQRPELSAALTSVVEPHPPPAPTGTDSPATLHQVSISWTASH